MKLQVFTVFDSKASAYFPPFYEKTKGSAIRAFTDSVNTADHTFNKHPEDYTLFELGSYEDETASFHLHKSPIAIGKANELLTYGDIPKQLVGQAHHWDSK